jgi:parallel beta-helix repeat protein
MTNITASKDSYGLYLNRTTYATLTGFHMTNNTFGISIDNSTDFYLDDGVALSNAGTDLYCSRSAYNSTLLSIKNSECGSSDCSWAPGCPIRSLPTLTPYPITGCATLSVPGEYTLLGGIVDQKTTGCFRIDADFVDFTCNNNTIEAVNGGGTAFNLSGTANVTVRDCRIKGFTNGFVANDTSGAKLNSSVVTLVGQGFNVSDSSSALLYNDTVDGFSSYGFSFSRTNNSGVYKDAAASYQPGYGFLFYDDFNNRVMNNTANYSAYGFYINDSRGNLIYNNSVFSSQDYDYYCSPNSGGLLSQKGGRVNYGLTKANCDWMVEIPFTLSSNLCRYMDTPDTIVMSRDLLYTYGDVCFSLYSNANTSADGSTINCAGHTVYAIDGGAFVSAHNTSVTVENCRLIGFTNPISFTSSNPVSGISVINNTILNTANTSIRVGDAMDSYILDNNATNSTDGIWVDMFNGSSVENNTVHKATDGIFVNNSESTLILNNTINNTFSSIKVINSQLMTVEKNKVTNSQS